MHGCDSPLRQFTVLMRKLFTLAGSTSGHAAYLFFRRLRTIDMTARKVAGSV